MSRRFPVHVITQGADASRAPLVLLHGSDGTELDLVPLAEDVATGAPRLAVRGTVTMDGGYSFFRRFPDRSIDAADLAERVPALVEFVHRISSDLWSGRRPVLLGYSNGAIMGAALLMSDPDLLAGAVLLRPLPPPLDAPGPRIDGLPVLILDGELDERRSPRDGLASADQLRRLGADVTHRILATGHPITDEDRKIIREWLQRNTF